MSSTSLFFFLELPRYEVVASYRWLHGRSTSYSWSAVCAMVTLQKYTPTYCKIYAKLMRNDKD